jgi:hypothetical protein
MKLSDIDFTKKENQTFKNWFKVMWNNFYIFPFLLALAFIIIIPFQTFESNWDYLIILIPIATCTAIAYKGFYQFWDDLKNNTNR